MIIKIVNVIFVLGVAVANLFFLFVALLAYGYQAPGAENFFYNVLIGISGLFLVSAVGAMFFRNWARRGLLTSSLLAWVALALRIVIKSEYFYFYNTHLGILLFLSIPIFILLTRKKLKAYYK